MATFKVIPQRHKRSDGTYKLRIQVYHQAQTVYMKANDYITDRDLAGKSMKIKNQDILCKYENIFASFRKTLLNEPVDQMTAQDIVDLLEQKKQNDKIEVFGYIDTVISKLSPGTARTYKAMSKHPQVCWGRKMTLMNSLTSQDLVNFIESFNNKG